MSKVGTSGGKYSKHESDENCVEYFGRKTWREENTRKN